MSFDDASAHGKQAVTVLGLGNMGSALAAALLDRGHEVTVWNRTPDKAQPLVARGARLAATPQEASASNQLIIACVLDYEALFGVLDPFAASLAGKTLVNLTSGSPEQGHEAAAWAEKHGVDYLDGGIMTTPPGVGTREVMFLYSGSPAVFATHRPTLEALGDPIHLGDDPGLASLYDSALLGLMWATFNGWLHGTALVGAEKIEAKAYTEVALRWLKTVSVFMDTYAAQIDAGDYPGDDATVDVQITTIDHLLHAAEARGVDNALPELLKASMLRAKAQGHGQDSYASVIEALRKPGGAS
ncbi:NAD(P)-dependent oxidoreductase [Streptomyces sp. NPDC087440]|uniref:NAD(P)-dependent oxidoreductase n=1 Tax=Streptomyces sp. NPDC087440 TaxID=3365790 RepID=UPI0037FD48E0